MNNISSFPTSASLKLADVLTDAILQCESVELLVIYHLMTDKFAEALQTTPQILFAMHEEAAELVKEER